MPNVSIVGQIVTNNISPIFISYLRGPVVIVGGGRSKLNEFAVGTGMGTELVGGSSIVATDALVRCKIPLP